MPLTTPRLLLPLFALLVLVVLVRGTAQAQAPCSHHAAPQGTGTACTAAQPCLVGTFLTTHAQPGRVLCLTDGTYTGDQSMLTLNVSGAAGTPITFRAVNDGAVLLDGQFGRRPIDCIGAHLTVQGVNARDGHDAVVVVRGQHCTLQRLVAWSTQADKGIDDVIDIGGSHNLVEDCAAFGYARKMLAAGSRGGTGPNTVRRCWVEHLGNRGTSGPTNPAEIGYDQDNVTFENIIARRNILSAADEPEAPLMAFSTRGSALLGSIAYALPEDTFDAPRLATILAEGGSHAGSGHVTTSMLVQDLVLLAAPNHTGVAGFRFEGGRGSAGNVARNLVAVAPQGGGECTGEGWTCTDLYRGTTLAAALGGKTVWEVAPGVCYEVVNRQVTSTPLWPWKMAARIQAALAQAGMPTRQVSDHLTRAVGPLPAACQRTPVPPDPGPLPPDAVPLACTGILTGQAVAIACAKP